MTLEINNIIYVLNPSPPKLIPGKIVEQRISRKVEGEDVTHIVSFANGKNYTLEKIEKPWFTSLDSAKSYLIEEANRLVESVLEEGHRQTKIHFKEQGEIMDFEPAPSENNFQTSDSDMVVEFGDGQKAKVTLPEILK